MDASRAWERGKAPTKSRGYARHGAPPPTRWTREQVRRGLAARKQRLLSDAALASARGDRQRAEALKSNAAGLRMRTDAVAVRRVAAERRSAAPAKPWELARSRHAHRVADDFMRQAEELAVVAGAMPDEASREQFQRAAEQLRRFAQDARPTPTRAQAVAATLQRERSRDAEQDRER